MLLSSVNALRENPGLFIYQTGKHGVQGLLRASRKTLYERDGTRLNAVCPGVTESEMTKVRRYGQKPPLYSQSANADVQEID